MKTTTTTRAAIYARKSTILEGPMQFTPDGKVYRFTGPTATSRLIAGMVGLPQQPPNGASPTGSDDGCTLEAVGKIAA